MASAVYKLFHESFKTLSPWAWQQCFTRGDVRIHDFNEVGDAGTLLDVVLNAALLDGSVGSWNVDKDDGRYGPHPETERLAVWLVNQGCNPWHVHQQRDSWSRALELGWPGLMTALRQHPQAPAKDVLEQTLVPRDSRASQFMVCAPASFARKNQTEALLAWHGLGFDVNLNVPDGVSAGSEALSPEFFAAWGQVGGQVQAKNSNGKTWPERWSFPVANRHIVMEKAWAKLQDGVLSSPENAVESLMKRIAALGKGRVQHEFQQHQINWSSTDDRGVTLRNRLLERFAQNPNGIAGSVVDFALANATTAQVRSAVTAGLKARTSSTKNSVYPNSEQLASLLVFEKLGPDDCVLRDLADAVKEQPNGFGLGLLIGLSREASRTFAPTLDIQPEVASHSGYAKAVQRAVAFWTPWFSERDDDGVMKGWKAFAAWAPSAARSNGGAAHYSFWEALVARQDPSVLLEGKNLLRACEAIRRPPTSEDLAANLWEAKESYGLHQSWVAPLAELKGLDTPTPDFMRPLEHQMWEGAFSNQGQIRKMVEPRLRLEVLARLDDRLPSAPSVVARPRM